MKRLCTLFLLILCCFTGCISVNVSKEINSSVAYNKDTEKTDTTEASASTPGKISGTVTTGEMNIHFIDVGQGDAILIESDGHFMLIDAGENNQGELVVDYAKAQGAEKLDYIIGTHPHSDHIGGLDNVIRAFEIGKVILPPVEHTTKTFEDVLDAMLDKNLKITKPVVGDTYSLGAASFIIIAPNKDYGEDQNNWSVGVKVSCKDTSFLSIGDAELTAEQDVCNNGIDLTADIIKLSHHGSSTSSGAPLIEAAGPKYAVISCGKDNEYGHPHEETLTMLEKRHIKAFRTDLQGSIIAEIDGSEISFLTNQNPVASPAKASPTKETKKEHIVHITKTGEKYHNTGCSSLKNSDIEITLEEAKLRGLTPCSKCNPLK